MKHDQSFSLSATAQAAMLERLNRCSAIRATIIPPAPPRPAPRLTFAVTDVHSLPSDYVTIQPDTAALQALADNWHEGESVPYLPGVRFTISTPEPKPCPHNPKTKTPRPRTSPPCS